MTDSTPTPLRFLWAVQPPSIAAGCAGAAVLGFGVFLAITAPGDASTIDTLMALALLLQMFLASSGFRQRCLRGHFDPLLAGGTSRWRVSAAHWVVSAGPGLAIWAAIVGLACWVRPRTWPAPATPPALLAVFVVSTVAWAVSLPTVKYAAGSVWIMMLLFLAATHRLAALRNVFYQTGWGPSFRAARAVIMCPLLLLSEASAVEPTVIGILAAAAVAAGVIGAVYIVRFDGRLVEVE